MNADLIGEDKYNAYIESFQRKIESMSNDTFSDVFDELSDTPTTVFNGPYTIAIDIDGNVYDE